MTHFDLFSGYGGFSLALERVYESNNSDGGTKIIGQVDSASDSPLPESRDEEGGQRAIITNNEQHADNRELLSSETSENIQQDSTDTTERQNGSIGSGFKTIGFSEIDKYASAVLKYHWPNTKNYGDITKINWSEVPDFDLLTGGSPCQDLSIAGKRAGLAGRRSGLFYEYMRAVREKRPKYFIWENVKGALSSSNGMDFTIVINEMAEAGYSLWWQVLNAKDFGVPQNRERIFVIGFRDGSPREVLFKSEQHQQNNREVASTLLARDYKGVGNQEMALVKSPRIRRLTPTECERLMGLPDGWTKYGSSGKRDEDGEPYMDEISDSQRYKLCGNGVVVNVVEELIKQIIL
jgi:DNA (cytosine-5)-methyltransferase 1